ncbi:hypothetical protein GQ42DRAFT_176709 [Ramicandelaber brevisporus]|nr:hypothetical protein GQ42DRAFT_176709 [Ramicandelaber brevisporus]
MRAGLYIVVATLAAVHAMPFPQAGNNAHSAPSKPASVDNGGTFEDGLPPSVPDDGMRTPPRFGPRAASSMRQSDSADLAPGSIRFARPPSAAVKLTATPSEVEDMRHSKLRSVGGSVGNLDDSTASFPKPTLPPMSTEMPVKKTRVIVNGNLVDSTVPSDLPQQQQQQQNAERASSSTKALNIPDPIPLPPVDTTVTSAASSVNNGNVLQGWGPPPMPQMMPPPWGGWSRPWGWRNNADDFATGGAPMQGMPDAASSPFAQNDGARPFGGDMWPGTPAGPSAGAFPGQPEPNQMIPMASNQNAGGMPPFGWGPRNASPLAGNSGPAGSGFTFGNNAANSGGNGGWPFGLDGTAFSNPFVPFVSGGGGNGGQASRFPRGPPFVRRSDNIEQVTVSPSANFETK